MKDFKNIPKEVKEIVDRVLASIIYSTDRTLIYKDPKKNFTRARKLPVIELFNLLLSRGAESLSKCLSNEFGPGKKRAGKSALVQQQAKFKVEFFEYFYKKLKDELACIKLFKQKYRLLAVDGSTFCVPCKDADCFNNTSKPHGKKGKDLYTIHLNTVYDVLTEMFEDIIIDTGKDVDEQAALLEMSEKLDNKTHPLIIVADRGYASYNTIAQLDRLGLYYVIRVKDITSDTSLAKTWWYKYYRGPENRAGEITVTVRFTRVGGKKVSSKENFKLLSPTTKFDLLPDDNPFDSDIEPEDIPEKYYHDITFRLVRIKINKKGEKDKEEFEMLITNLPADIFPARELKTIYHLRWGLEGAYRELKYDEKAIFFHSKKKEFILEELYLSISLHNIVAYICAIAGKNLLSIKGQSSRKKLKHEYAINHSKASETIREYLSLRSESTSEHIMEELVREMEIIRKKRKFDRKLVPKGVIPFTYRSA